MTSSGLFVTFEGGEGAGKSTLVRRLQEALQKESYEVVVTREPGGTSFSEEVRNLVLHRKGTMHPRSELFLFLASRIQHLEELIKPALMRGAIVLCDRFSDSSVAYQGEARGLGMEYVSSCCTLATGGMQPDLTFYVDLDPKIGLMRMHQRQASTNEAPDRLENEALIFHEKVRTGFQKIAQANPSRIKTLDGNQTPDDLFTTAYTHLKQALK
ncbi:MAG: dTMP kinase [Chlamydiales bacterium]|nr:dTMP kinase [Chlamydiales bacterium]